MFKCIEVKGVLVTRWMLAGVLLAASGGVWAQGRLTDGMQAGAEMAEQAGSMRQSQGGSHGTAVLAYWYGANYHTPFVVDETTGKTADIARNSVEFMHSAQWGC
ncbi:MAG TPA: hypothetical protein VL135_15985 [Terracidiphilus sp.]|nr:hypothetical protein [Terracidiphilus sp.]